MPYKLLYAEYIGLARTNQIEDLLRKVLFFTENGNISHLIINLKNMQGAFSGSTNYIENDFYPIMTKNGTVSLSLIVSKDVFTNFTLKSIKIRSNRELKIRTFCDLEDAKNWVKFISR